MPTHRLLGGGRTADLSTPYLGKSMPPKTMLAGFPSNSAGYQVFPHTSELY